MIAPRFNRSPEELAFRVPEHFLHHRSTFVRDSLPITCPVAIAELVYEGPLQVEFTDIQDAIETHWNRANYLLPCQEAVAIIAWSGPTAAFFDAEVTVVDVVMAR